MAYKILDNDGNVFKVNDQEAWAVDFDIEIKQPAENDDGKRVIGMVGSTPSVDRDNDIIEQSGWDVKTFRKSSSVLWSHDHKIPAIAKVNKLTKTKESLTFDEIEFPKAGIHGLADMVYELMLGGFIKAGSVGFLPIKSEKRERTEDEEKNEPRSFCPPTKFLKQELLEFSIVNVGSNRDALITHLGAKGFNTSGKVKIQAEDGKEVSIDMAEILNKLFAESNNASGGIVTEPAVTTIGDGKPEAIIPVPEGVLSNNSGEKEPSCADCDIEMDQEKTIEIDKEQVEKPFENEHSCRLISPSQFDSFRRQNNAAQHEGKRLDFIFGIKEGKSKLQAIRYPKSIWTSSSAKTHCSGRNGTFEAASKEINAKILRLESGFFFDFQPTKEMKEAGTEFRLCFVSGTERCTEATLQVVGDDKETWNDLQTISIEDIEQKAGAVLSKANKGKLKNAQALIGEVLAASEPVEVVTDDESDKNTEPPEIKTLEITLSKEITDIFGELSAKIQALETRLDEKTPKSTEGTDDIEIDLDNIALPEKKNEINLDDLKTVISQAFGDKLRQVVNEKFDKALGKV